MQIFFTKIHKNIYICIMNKNITKLFVVNLGNRTVAVETNLKHLIDRFKEVEPKAGAYITYFQKFKSSKEFDHVIDGKTYHFQQLYP